MKKNNTKSEQFNIQFLGMKFNSVNPGKKTITILVILLLFFLVLIFLLKTYALPAIAVIGGTNMTGTIATKAFTIKKWIKGRSP